MELLPIIGDSDFMKVYPKDNKIYLYADASCIESGSIGGLEKLFENTDDAKVAFKESFDEMHSQVEDEISIIKGAPGTYTFQSAYTVMAALIEVPGSIQTAEQASQWISQELSDDEEMDDRIRMFEGFSVNAHKKTKLSSDDLWERFH